VSAQTVQAQATSLLTRPLLTHELGSLAKPNWRVKAITGAEITDRDLEEARAWGRSLAVDGYQDLIDLLGRAPLDQKGKAEVKRWSSTYGVRLLESVGLDVVYDGEQQRSEMYAWAVAHAGGFEWRGSVRAFDNKYYSKAAVTGPISLRVPYHNEEFAHAQEVARADLKVPITGAYTLADWSFDEHYFTDADLGGSGHRSRRREARRLFILDLARDLIRPNVEALIGLGARWIQIDEPGGSTEPDELDLFVESFNESVAGLEAVFSTHLCFSDYDLFFPGLEAMTGCRQFAVGFANYDSREPGTRTEDRPGYRVLPRFRDLPYRPVLGIGVLDIHTDFVEPPELVRDRVVHSVDVFGDPARIHVIPDCGLRTRSWDVAHAKLENMVAGVELAKKDLGL
jgi:5-methyltetrahydropteroyltriglutamate--homocysteine methyltransferase